MILSCIEDYLPNLSPTLLVGGGGGAGGVGGTGAGRASAADCGP
jgi:hypothetical protein